VSKSDVRHPGLYFRAPPQVCVSGPLPRNGSRWLLPKGASVDIRSVAHLGPRQPAVENVSTLLPPARVAAPFEPGPRSRRAWSSRGSLDVLPRAWDCLGDLSVQARARSANPASKPTLILAKPSLQAHAPSGQTQPPSPRSFRGRGPETQTWAAAPRNTNLGTRAPRHPFGWRFSSGCALRWMRASVRVAV
jgi:hypothetical protein